MERSALDSLCVFLTARSRIDLIRRCAPVYKHVFADAVCLIQRLNLQQLRALPPLGTTLRMTLTGCWTSRDHQIALVQFSGKHRRLPYTAQRPCILISAQMTVQDKAFVLPVVQERDGDFENEHLNMQGVLGAYVYDDASAIAWRKVIWPSLFHPERSFAEPSLSTIDVEIVFGKDERPITQLNIFDFDGTLMSSPDEFTGKAEYAESTGRPYPHLGWFGKQESLLPPIRVLPGPALRDYHSFFGRDGSWTVILTGRLESTRPAMEQVLQGYGITYDELICKTSAGDTWDFKISVALRLLRSFKHVRRLRVWEDNVENLVKFYELRESLKDSIDVEIYEAPTFSLSKLSSLDASFWWEDRTYMIGIASFLEAMGCFPANQYWIHAQKGLEFLTATWKDALRQDASIDAWHVVTGDFAFGRRGTIDLWFRIPNIGVLDDATLCFEQLLQEKGIAMRQQEGRLEISLCFATFPPIHYAIRFIQTDCDVFVEQSSSVDIASRLAVSEDLPLEIRTDMHVQARWQRQTRDSSASRDAHSVACELLEELCHAQVGSKGDSAPHRYTLLMNLILSFGELLPEAHFFSADRFCGQLMEWMTQMSIDQLMEHVVGDCPAVEESDDLRGALDGLQCQVGFLLSHQGSHEGQIEWTCLFDAFQRRR